MMVAVREWITGIVAVTLLLSVAQTLIPQGSMRKVASFIGGLILLLSLLQPVLQVDVEDLQPDFEGYRASVAQQRKELEADSREELGKLIEEKAGAYISDKAAELGLQVTVEVTARPNEDGTMVPDAAEVTGPPVEELADYMEQELGISRERQVWTDGKS